MNKSLFPYSPKNPILYLLTFNFFQVLYVQTGSVYWASTSQSNDLAYSMYFVVGEKHRGVDANYREFGTSVHLVMDYLEE